MAPPDRELDPLLRSQHGAFSRDQALGAGFTGRMIHRRLASGEWLHLDSSVYALAGHPFSWERQAMAATLSIEGAVLSGRAAAAHHGIDGFRRGRLEVTVTPNRGARSRLATVRRLTRIHATVVDGIPTLDVADTVLSLAGALTPDALERLVDAVLVARLERLERIEDRFVPFAGSRGSVALREILLSRSAGAAVPPSSDLERVLRSVLGAPGLPSFTFETEMPWWPDGEGRVDAYSHRCCLIVEADGRAWHTRERDFVKDRQRDNLAAANGHAVLRFTYGDLVDDPVGCRELVRATARARGWRGGGP